MSIEVYAFEDAAGNTPTEWTTQDIKEAREFAQRYGYRLIARIFEFSDSQLVEDYTTADEEEEVDQEKPLD